MNSIAYSPPEYCPSILKEKTKNLLKLETPINRKKKEVKIIDVIFVQPMKNRRHCKTGLRLFVQPMNNKEVCDYIIHSHPRFLQTDRSL